MMPKTLLRAFHVICFCALGLNAYGAGYAIDGMYSLSGRVVHVTRDDSETMLGRKLRIEVEILNNGSEPLILWNRDASDISGESKISRVVVSKTPEFRTDEVIGIHNLGPPNFYGEAWGRLRLKLDNATPPAELTIIIKPGESHKFSVSVKFYFEKKYGPKGKEVWVRLEYASWSPNIEPKGPNRASKLSFGRTLQGRWKSDGALMLENLISEPIKVSLENPTEGGQDQLPCHC